MSPSAYRSMWLMAMFDLPVDTKEYKRQYARFRAALLKDGFMMLQYSVYARYAASEEAAEVHRKRVRSALPREGQVRVVTLTDVQFGRMEVYTGKRRKVAEDAPKQILLF